MDKDTRLELMLRLNELGYVSHDETLADFILDKERKLKDTLAKEQGRADGWKQNCKELEERVKELECVIDAWHTIFGTTQLTHAQARLEVAESKVAKLESTIAEMCKPLEEVKRDMESITYGDNPKHNDWNCAVEGDDSLCIAIDSALRIAKGEK
jgi:phage shock protein A